MLIHCTKELLNKIKPREVSDRSEEPLYSWHANLVTLDQKNCVVLVNDQNKYVVVLYNLRKRELKELDKIAINALHEILSSECIRGEVVNEFVERAGNIYYAPTKDRSSIARVSKACELLSNFQAEIREDTVIQTALSKRLSRLLVSSGSGSRDYIRPNEELSQDLRLEHGEPLFSCRAVQLFVILDLGEHSVWRRVLVPANICFEQLHQVLQVAFGWQDSHLHEFYLYGEETCDNFLYPNHPGYHWDGYKPIINLVSHKGALNLPGDIPQKLEKGVKLSEYIPCRIKYNYDLGDNWQHYVEIEDIIDHHDKNHPICLAGEGEAPPEDVGGPVGYQEFLTIASDKQHPDHNDLLSWGESQGYSKFDINEVNLKLKSWF